MAYDTTLAPHLPLVCPGCIPSSHAAASWCANASCLSRLVVVLHSPAASLPLNVLPPLDALSPPICPFDCHMASCCAAKLLTCRCLSTHSLVVRWPLLSRLVAASRLIAPPTPLDAPTPTSWRAVASSGAGAMTSLTDAPVDERIGHCNMLKKWCEEVECDAVKIMKLSILCYDSICLMCGCWWHILPPLTLSYPEKENRQAQGRNWK